MKVTQRQVTQLAKSVMASHLRASENPVLRQARAIPWVEVEAAWFAAQPKERADYRWEAAQVLRTMAARFGGDGHGR